jgi:hypothetical protein
MFVLVFSAFSAFFFLAPFCECPLLVQLLGERATMLLMLAVWLCVGVVFSVEIYPFFFLGFFFSSSRLSLVATSKSWRLVAAGL